MFNLKNYLSVDFEMKLIKIRGGVGVKTIYQRPHMVLD